MSRGDWGVPCFPEGSNIIPAFTLSDWPLVNIWMQSKYLQTSPGLSTLFLGNVAVGGRLWVNKRDKV